MGQEYKGKMFHVHTNHPPYIMCTFILSKELLQLQPFTRDNWYQKCLPLTNTRKDWLCMEGLQELQKLITSP